MEYWKYKAIDRLKDYPAQKAAILNIPDEIEALESQFTSIRSATTDSTAVAGGGNKREDMMLSNIVRREELKMMLERARLYVRSVERGMEILNDDELRALNAMYVNRESGAVARLSEEFCEDERSVYRRLDKALRHFTIAMYGVTEN